MADNRWTKLSLRVSSSSLTAENIEHAISVESVMKANAGDPVSARSVAAGLHTKALCVFDCPLPSRAALDEHVNWVVQFVERHALGIESIADKCEVDIRIGFSSSSGQGGFAISGESLALLGRFKTNVFVNLYPPESETDDADE